MYVRTYVTSNFGQIFSKGNGSDNVETWFLNCVCFLMFKYDAVMAACYESLRAEFILGSSHMSCIPIP